MIKIWGRNTSVNVQKVMWAVGELKLAHERIDVGGAFGKNREPAYLAMNPNGLVPTLEEDDFILWESNTIVRYLAAKYGAGTLEPSDLRSRARAQSWMDWQLAVAAPAIHGLFWGLVRTPPEKRDPAALETARQRAAEYWKMVESQLARGDYLAGDALTLADICVGIWGYRWHAYPIERPSLPRLKAWCERLAHSRGFKAHVDAPIK